MGSGFHSPYFSKGEEKMRNLQNPDIFAFGRIIKQANIKEEIKKLALDKNTDVESY